jgi:hypothetical protein
VRIRNTTWTGTIAVNERGYKNPYMVELDNDTMKRLPLDLRPKYEEHYYGPCSAEELKLL